VRSLLFPASERTVRARTVERLMARRRRGSETRNHGRDGRGRGTPRRRLFFIALARELFPDVLSYVVGTPAIYGFATRNGRPMADNAPEAMLSLVSGTAVPSGLNR
jgi:hypothetical protein